MKIKEDIDILINREISRAGFDVKLLGIINYVFSTGGKRLRPLMFLETYSLSGNDANEAVEKFAVAIECLHQYTLVHDDLPCMDNDSIRRGMPSCHAKYGETFALLAGDALLNYAYTLILDAIKISGYDKNFVNAAYAFSVLSGGSGVIGGQFLEFASTSPLSDVFDVYRRKTCYLMWGAVYAGAVIAKLPQNTINRLNEYVYNYGFCFQICDDFADIKEKGEVSSQSIVSLYGPEKSKKMAIEAADNAKKSLVMSGINSDFFTGLIDKLVGILVD